MPGILAIVPCIKDIKFLNHFPLYKQLEIMDCGPTCLMMIAKFYGRSIPLDYLRDKSQYGRHGVSLLGLTDAAESIGLETLGVKLTFDQLVNKVPLPAIIHWDEHHFVVLLPFSGQRRDPEMRLQIADPAKGFIELNKEEFLKHWVSTPLLLDSGETEGTGIALLFESTPRFEAMDFSDAEPEKEKS